MRSALVLIPLLLAGCTAYGQPGPYNPYPQPYPQYPQGYSQGYPPVTSPVDVGYRATGTEPFWDLTIGSQLTFNDRGRGTSVVQPTPPVQHGVAGEIYATPRLNVNIVHAQCSDGMSDRRFPDRVEVRVDGQLYRGCGEPFLGYGNGYANAGPTPALDQTNWRVDSINGVRVPASNFYMDFLPTGLDAKFGCNGLHGTYRSSGNQISFSPIVATRMACANMDFERQGLAVLARSVTANWGGPDHLTLSNSAGSIELSRAGNNGPFGNIFR